MWYPARRQRSAAVCLSLLGGASRAGAEPLKAPLLSHSQGLRREIQAHGPRLEEVLERAGALASL